MSNIIKEAAASLLNKGEITQEEYDTIDFEKMAFELSPSIIKYLKTPKDFAQVAKNFIKNPKAIETFKEDIASSPELAEALAKEYARKPNIGETIGQNIHKLWPAPVAIASLFALKEGIVDPLVQSHQIQKSYEQLSEKVPQLAEVDQKTIRDYFDVIKTYSPQSAANPLVAGALVNKMMEFGGVDHKLVQDIINIQSGKRGTEAVKTMISTGLGTLSKPEKD